MAISSAISTSESPVWPLIACVEYRLRASAMRYQKDASERHTDSNSVYSVACVGDTVVIPSEEAETDASCATALSTSNNVTQQFGYQSLSSFVDARSGVIV